MDWREEAAWTLGDIAALAIIILLMPLFLVLWALKKLWPYE